MNTNKLSHKQSAVVFFGVPNLSKSVDLAETTLEQMIRAQSPNLKSLDRTRLTSNAVQDVVNVCKKFKLVPITVPVISLSERRPTTIQTPRLVGIKGRVS